MIRDRQCNSCPFVCAWEWACFCHLPSYSSWTTCCSDVCCTKQCKTLAADRFHIYTLGTLNISTSNKNIFCNLCAWLKKFPAFLAPRCLFQVIRAWGHWVVLGHLCHWCCHAENRARPLLEGPDARLLHHHTLCSITPFKDMTQAVLLKVAGSILLVEMSVIACLLYIPWSGSRLITLSQCYEAIDLGFVQVQAGMKAPQPNGCAQFWSVQIKVLSDFQPFFGALLKRYVEFHRLCHLTFWLFHYSRWMSCIWYSFMYVVGW